MLEPVNPRHWNLLAPQGPTEGVGDGLAPVALKICYQIEHVKLHLSEVQRKTG